MGPISSHFDPLGMVGWIILMGINVALYVLAIWKSLILLNDRCRLRRNTVLLCAPVVIVVWSIVFFYVLKGLFHSWWEM